MKPQSVMAVLFVFVGLFTACKPASKPKNFIVTVDFSSSRDSLVIHWYKQTIQQSILRKMGKGDRIIILPVDHNSELWGQEIFKVDFSAYNFENEFAGLQKEEIERKNFQDSVTVAMKIFEQNFDAAKAARYNFNNGTDVLGALKQSQKYILPDHKNILILLCDMMQVTDKKELNLEDNLQSTEQIDKSLKSIKAIELPETKVMVLTGPQVNMAIGKFNVIKAFWEKYFEKANVELLDYSSTAVTKLEQVVTN